MAALTLRGVTRHFGALAAVDGVDLEVPEGRLVCFLGPSGCGKTTLLRLVAGLDLPSAGQIWMDEREITTVPAHRRDIGMVFQSLALFPHLNVADNIAYSLRIRGASRERQRHRTAELLDLVRLPGAESRHASQLSGGQRQRVAIARALALEPQLFLLDEPLSALDAKLREEMQVELKLLQQRVGVTTVLVTHDQREAMTMADLVVVMDQGRVQQIGSPLELYRRPVSTFVAQFVGTSNLLPGVIADGGRVRIGDRTLRLSEPPALPEGSEVTVSIRPEEVRPLPGGEGGDNRLSGTIAFVRDVGQSVELYVDCEGLRVTSRVQPRDKPDLAQGDALTVELPGDACVVLQ